MVLVACPGQNALEEYLLGRISEEQANNLEEHLSGCGSCLRGLQSLHPADAVVSSFQSQAKQSRPVNPRVQQLRQQLCELFDSRSSMPAETYADDVTGAGLSQGPILASARVPGLVLSPPSPGTPTQLGPYLLLAELGAGGMGKVYRAEDPALRRLIALKVMRPEIASREEARQRFLREARAIAAVTHDNIVTVHHVGEDRGVPYLTMPLLQGESLEQRLDREKCLPLGEALRIARETAQGLAAAHERGLIHRDIKPGNLWLETPLGRVKILDFGLARGLAEGGVNLTGEGSLLGTPAYMAPEQAGGSADHRADLFSLGCVLYRMTTGRPAFEGSTVLQVLNNLANHEPAPAHEVSPEVPAEVGKFIQRMLSKKPEDRPVSAGVVARVLDTLQQKHAPCSVARTGLPQPGDEAARTTSHPVPVALAVPSQKQASTLDTVALPAARKPAWSRWATRRNAGIAAAVLVLIGGVVVATLGPGGSKPVDPAIPPTENRNGGTAEKDGGPVEREPQPPGRFLKPLMLTAYVSRPTFLDGIESWEVITNEVKVPVGQLCLLGDRILALYTTGRWVHWDFNLNKFVDARRGGNYSAISPNRDMVVVLPRTGGNFDLVTDKGTVTCTGHLTTVSQVQFSPDGKYLASTSNVGDLRFWDAENKCPVGDPVRGFNCLCNWSKNSTTLVGCSLKGNRVVLIDRANRSERKSFEIGQNIADAALSPDERWLAVGVQSGRVQLFDVANTTVTPTFLKEGLSRSNRSDLAWSPDSKLLAYFGVEESLVLYDLSGEKPTLKHKFLGHDGDPLSVLFAPDGQTLISSTTDGSVRFWDLTHKQLRASLALLGDGKWLAVSAEGHYRGYAGCEANLFYRVREKGSMMIQPNMEPHVFKDKFHWVNDEKEVRLLGETYIKPRGKSRE